MMEIEFIHFTPREAFKKELKFQVERVLAECPSDADAQVRAIFQPERFVLEIAIQSSQGRFRTVVAVPIPKKGAKDRDWQAAAVVEMSSEITRQVHRWRDQRFKSANKAS